MDLEAFFLYWEVNHSMSFYNSNILYIVGYDNLYMTYQKTLYGTDVNKKHQTRIISMIFSCNPPPPHFSFFFVCI